MRVRRQVLGSMHSVLLTQPSRSAQKTTLFLFSSKMENGGELIDKYLNDAFTWYTEQVGKSVDNSRYMYMLIQKDSPLSSEENNDNARKVRMNGWVGRNLRRTSGAAATMVAANTVPPLSYAVQEVQT